MAADQQQRKECLGAAMVVALLTWISLLSRLYFDFDGALDTDAINFGLGAFDFDILKHQPHPPGYPGYIVLLKAVHLVAPGLGPLELAKWGCRLCGVALTPAMYWACRALQHVQRRDEEFKSGEYTPAIITALFAVTHPLLWYYGADGQSHGAEALFVTVLVALTAHGVKRNSNRLRYVIVAAFALAGSVRPSIALLSSPLLVWLFWRQPLKAWAIAFLVGVTFVLSWYAPLIYLSGGWDLYRRAGDALLGEMFVANYSILGKRASLPAVAANFNSVLYCMVLSGIPLLALARRVPAQARSWWLTWVSVLIVSVLFYALFYTAEAGYFSGVAALCCLVPAMWPRLRSRALMARATATALLGPLFFIFAPNSVPVVFHGGFFLPSFSHLAMVEAGQVVYRNVICQTAGTKSTLVLTDNPVTTHTRLVPVYCPNVTLGLYLHDLPLNPKLDNWLIFTANDLTSIPTKVPLETGPAVTAQLTTRFAQVIMAPDASPRFFALLQRQATCPPEHIVPPEFSGSHFQLELWPASCLTQISAGKNTLRLRE